MNVNDYEMMLVLSIFRDILMSRSLLEKGRKLQRYFRNPAKLSFVDVLMFYIFRCKGTLGKDINAYFEALSMECCSRQALIAATCKIEPEVFRIFIQMFSARLYSDPRVTIYKYENYMLVAVDGSHMDLPSAVEIIKKFGGNLNGSIKNPDDIKKPQARVSMLYDPVNMLVLDALVRPYDTSEQSMLYEHLDACRGILRNRKVILLADRNYPSAELFLLCMMRGYDFVIRSKKNFYKDEIDAIVDDGTITLKFTEPWIKRMKNPELAEYARQVGQLTLRTIKNYYAYKDPDTGKIVVSQGIYIVSENLKHLTRSEIVHLYHKKRWQVETGYFNLKSHLEAERLSSRKVDTVTVEIYAKFLCLSLAGCVYTRVTDIIQKKREQNQKLYVQKGKGQAKGNADQTPSAPVDQGTKLETDTQQTAGATHVDTETASSQETPTTSEGTPTLGESSSSKDASGTEPKPKDANDKSATLDESSSPKEASETGSKTSDADDKPATLDESSSPKEASGTESKPKDANGKAAPLNDGQKTVRPRKANMQNVCSAIQNSNKLFCIIRGTYCEIYIDETEGEFSDRFLQNLAAESIPEIDGRHVARWGRYIRHLPHYKFRVDGRRNPFIEQCRNGSIGYVTRR